MQVRRIVVTIASLLVACGPKPGTYVEVVNTGAERAYVAGAAGPGMSYGTACEAALMRASSALAKKFAEENDDLADDIAEAVGATDGEAFLHKYAEAEAKNATVLGKDFDPIDHICMATLRWTPPLFVKDAVLAYAQRVKERELGKINPAPKGPEQAAPVAAASPAPQTPAPVAAQTPPPAPIVAPPPASPAPTAPPKPAAPKCEKEQRAFLAQTASSFKVEQDLSECMRRTKDDATVCHRYKLYVDKSRAQDAEVANDLAGCKNGGLAPRLRQSVAKALPGAAAVALETRGDGTVLVWAYRLLDGTGVAVEVSASGGVGPQAPLAENQIDWVREQLGL